MTWIERVETYVNIVVGNARSCQGMEGKGRDGAASQNVIRGIYWMLNQNINNPASCVIPLFHPIVKDKQDDGFPPSSPLPPFLPLLVSLRLESCLQIFEPVLVPYILPPHPCGTIQPRQLPSPLTPYPACPAPRYRYEDPSP